MLEKFPGESALFDIDCSQLLGTTETIIGSPVLAFLPALVGGDALTFGTPAVNTEAVTYAEADGTTRTVPAGKVIQVRISGGTATGSSDSRRYYVSATFTTSASNTLVAKADLKVLPLGA